MMQHRPEAEFVGETQRRQDVVVTMGVEVDDPRAIEHLSERLHLQVPSRQRGGVAPRNLLLLPVLLRPYEEGADEGGGARPGAGEGRGALRVGPVGHLHPAADVPGEVIAQHQLVDGAGIPQLQVHGLAAHEVARPGHDVRHRHPAGLGALDPVIPGIDGVEDPHGRVQGTAPIPAIAASDVAVGVHQARHDHLAGYIVTHRIVGNPGAGRPDRLDRTVADHQHAVLDGVARDGDDLRADEGVGRRLGVGRRGHEGEEHEADVDLEERKSGQGAIHDCPGGWGIGSSPGMWTGGG